MTAKNSGRYYGRFGYLCPARDLKCLRRVECLTHAPICVTHPSLNNTYTSHTCTAAYAAGAAQARQENTASILRGDQNVWRDTKLPHE